MRRLTKDPVIEEANFCLLPKSWGNKNAKLIQKMPSGKTLAQALRKAGLKEPPGSWITQEEAEKNLKRYRRGRGGECSASWPGGSRGPLARALHM